MGQTLTHGIYLPDEGERNCYDGLAGNWQILDSSVGTIAANTSALAGKAPLVHTHTKSDVTDLFNSANTWTGINTFSNFIISKESAAISAGGYGKGIAFRDYQNNRLGYIQPFLTSNNEKRLLIGADSGDIASNSNIIPNSNNSVNLGSSSYQWNNLYAKKVNTQSVNGINPGALSLPSNIGYDPIDTRNWDLTGNPSSPNWYTPTTDGWLCVIALAGTMTDAWLDIWVDSLWGQSASQSPSGELFCIIPVRAGLNVRVRVKASYIFDARIFVATGNV